MKFKNLKTNQIEIVASSFGWFWVLNFGPLYWASKKMWKHAIINLILFIITFGLCQLVYPFFMKSIFRKYYLDLGWVEEQEEKK